MRMQNFDVAIIGGGIMGCSVAYNLMKIDNGMQVVVLERDPSYSQASTALSMSNIRIQFSLKENIQISLYAFEVLDNFETEMAVEDRIPRTGFRREGNLFLVEAAGRPQAVAGMELQRALGCAVEWWPADEIRRRLPLYRPEALEGGTFGAGDGYIDAYGVLMGYRSKARSLGADFRSVEVGAVLHGGGKVTGVQLASGERITAGVVVNCAGAWAAQVAETAGILLPVVPVKRQVFVLDTAVKPDGPLPLTVLPSGLYFRTETGGHILLGKSLPEDPVGFDFTWDDTRFMEVLWPELAAFVPAFDAAKLVRGWAGLYAVNTLDGNALLGEWPELKGFFLANGFSGHGLQQAPAAGRYVAECITGAPPSLDLSIFDPRRVLENRPLSESGLV